MSSNSTRSTDYPRGSDPTYWPSSNKTNSNKSSLKDEFIKLVQKFYSPDIFSEAKQNSHHYNRTWPYFLPNNATRFKISGDENFHYNANWVLDKRALVCQSPLGDNETTQFWRMVVDSGATKIVMLTNLKEQATREDTGDRCSDYWSSCDCVELSSIEIGAGIKIIKRDITIYDETGEPRVLRQYQVQNWPQDGEIPAEALAKIVEIVACEGLTDEKYIVHCGFGRERSGAFLATLEAFKQKTDNIFPIYNELSDPDRGRANILTYNSICENIYYTVAKAAKILLGNRKQDINTKSTNVDPFYKLFWSTSTSIRPTTTSEEKQKQEEDDIFNVWEALAKKLGEKNSIHPKLRNLNKDEINVAFDQWCEKKELTEITYLDLSSLNLRSLPNQLNKLVNLNILDLSSNFFTEMPNCLKELNHIEELYLQNNEIHSISEDFCEMTNLKKVLLCNNKLTQLPAEFKKMINLTELNLSGNQIKQDQVAALLSIFDELDSLFDCNLKDNDVSRIEDIQKYFPKKIQDTFRVWEKIAKAAQINIDDLNQVHLSSEAKIEKVKSFDDWIVDNKSQLLKVKKLDLISTNIRYVPKQIGQLVNLEDLSLSHNLLEKVPEFVKNLPTLHTLSLSENLILEFNANAFPRNLQALYIFGNAAILSPEMLEFGNYLKIFRNNLNTARYQTSQNSHLAKDSASTTQNRQSLTSSNLRQLPASILDKPPFTLSIKEQSASITQNRQLLTSSNVRQLPSSIQSNQPLASANLRQSLSNIQGKPPFVLPTLGHSASSTQNNQFFSPSTLEQSRLSSSISHTTLAKQELEKAKASVALWQALGSQKLIYAPEVFDPANIIADAEKFKKFFEIKKDDLAKSVKEIDLSSKLLTCVPSEIYELKNLKTLNLSKNSISSIPLLLITLFEVEQVILDDNPITKDEIELFEKHYRAGKCPAKITNPLPNPALN